MRRSSWSSVYVRLLRLRRQDDLRTSPDWASGPRWLSTTAQLRPKQARACGTTVFRAPETRAACRRHSGWIGTPLHTVDGHGLSPLGAKVYESIRREDCRRETVFADDNHPDGGSQIEHPRNAPSASTRGQPLVSSGCGGDACPEIPVNHS